jgi:hypothetical protein
MLGRVQPKSCAIRPLGYRFLDRNTPAPMIERDLRPGAATLFRPPPATSPQKLDPDPTDPVAFGMMRTPWPHRPGSSSGSRGASTFKRGCSFAGVDRHKSIAKTERGRPSTTGFGHTVKPSRGDQPTIVMATTTIRAPLPRRSPRVQHAVPVRFAEPGGA